MADRRRDLLGIVLMAAAYYVSGLLGLLLAIPPGYATAVWPPSGIALAAMLAYGHRLWPGVFLGSFLLNVDNGLDHSSLATLLSSFAASLPESLPIPAIIAAGAALQAVIGAALIRRWVGYSNILTQELDVIRLLLIGGPLCCLINSCLSVTALLVAGKIHPDALLFNWWTWWIGDSIGVLVFTPAVLVWTVRPFSRWRRQQLIVTLPLTLMFALVVAIFVFTKNREQARTVTELEGRAADVVARLQSDLDRYRVGITAVAGFFSHEKDVTSDQFSGFASLLLSQLPGLHGVTWDVVVPEAKREAFEASMRAQGFPDFRIVEPGADGRMVPAASRDPHVVVGYVSYQHQKLGAQGLDVAFSPVRQEALKLAAQRNEPIATALLDIYGASPGDEGFLVYMPVFSQGSEPAGFATLVILLDQVMQQVLTGRQKDGLAVRLVDRTRGVDRVLFGGTEDASTQQGSLQVATPVEIFGRSWELQCILPAAYLIAHQPWQAWTVLAAGLVLTALLGMLLLFGAPASSSARCHCFRRRSSPPTTAFSWWIATPGS
jgi:CHASE1-domain containing sensor protein